MTIFSSASVDYLFFSIVLLIVYIAVHAAALTSYRNVLRMTRIRLRRPFLKAFFLGLVGMLLFVGLGWPFTRSMENGKRDELRNSTLALAQAYASVLSQYELDEAYKTMRSSNGSYRQMSDTMRRWMQDQPNVQSMYLLSKDESGNNLFLIAPETDYDKNGRIEGFQEQAIPPGTPYDSYIPELETAFLGESVMEKEPSRDDWGISLSAFVPVLDSGGKVVAVIGLDLDGRETNRLQQMERMKGYGILLFPFSLILASYVLYVRRTIERSLLSSKQEELQREEEKYRTLSDSSVEGMVIHRDGVILDVNRALCRMLGYESRELVGRSIYPLVHPGDHEGVRSRLPQQVVDAYRVRGIHKDGSILDVELYVNSCLYNGEPSRAVAVRDITAQKRQEEMIYRLAYYDDLTGLPNKKRFLRSLTRWLAHAGDRKAAVLFMDLNKFKPINDSFGHSTGDAAIRECAERLKLALPPGARIARWGGDEFVVLLPDVRDRSDAAEAANRFVDVLDKPVFCKGVPVKIGTCVGISLYPEDGTDEETLLRKADTAMFTGKRFTGRSIHFFDSTLQEKAEHRVRMEQELRTALQEDQLELYYQPQVEMHSGSIIGAEALIRWHHPTRGFISPMEFIPLAEETGLILQIGDWVLRRACRDMKQMREEGSPNLRIAVNLSVLQFENEHLAESISSILEESELPPRQLELEITETMMMDPDHALDILLRLKGLGVRISIDDFGTGFSSLHYLNRFPIDKVKIDRSFITDLGIGDAPITTAIVSMAKTLRLETIAEGVETPLQAEQLMKLGCSVAQGFLYYKPMTKEQFLQVLRQRAAV